MREFVLKLLKINPATLLCSSNRQEIEVAQANVLQKLVLRVRIKTRGLFQPVSVHLCHRKFYKIKVNQAKSLLVNFYSLKTLHFSFQEKNVIN